jgi:hypothetical protein
MEANTVKISMWKKARSNFREFSEKQRADEEEKRNGEEKTKKRGGL